MILRLTLSATMFGQLCQNVMHWIPKGADTGPLLLQTAALASKDWITQYRGVLNQQVVYFRTEVTRYDNGAASLKWTENYNIAGAGVSDFASQLNACEVLRFETGHAGRSHKGRQYIPGMSPGFTSAGLITAARITQWASPILGLKDKFLLSSANSQFGLVIWRKGQADNDAVPVTEISLRATPGSMRRRMVGVGV